MLLSFGDGNAIFRVRMQNMVRPAVGILQFCTELLLPRFEVHWNKLVSTEYCLVDEQASIVTGVKLPII